MRQTWPTWIKFQSTRPRGARLALAERFYNLMIVSIHAPARGATAGVSRKISDKRCFNPRARAGRDVGDSYFPSISNVSIHAPARGATHPLLRPAHRGIVSIHAPARGATPKPWNIHVDNFRFNPRARAGRDARRQHDETGADRVSIHAPARGATYGYLLVRYCRLLFQSTRPRGARPPYEGSYNAQGTVSIHAPARGAT